jgi:hypothetical protein
MRIAIMVLSLAGGLVAQSITDATAAATGASGARQLGRP